MTDFVLDLLGLIVVASRICLSEALIIALVF